MIPIDDWIDPETRRCRYCQNAGRIESLGLYCFCPNGCLLAQGPPPDEDPS